MQGTLVEGERGMETNNNKNGEWNAYKIIYCSGRFHMKKEEQKLCPKLNRFLIFRFTQHIFPSFSMSSNDLRTYQWLYGKVFSLNSWTKFTILSSLCPL